MGLFFSVFVALFLSFFGCVFANENGDKMQAKQNSFWWPNIIDLSPLRSNSVESSPMGAAYNYKKEFSKLNINNVKKDIKKVITTSQDWWPADYGNYGPFFIRMAWHSAGTYRTSDGRGGASGGQQRFEPLNSWPDNANLDKARRLLWSVKQKYGNMISWADLMILSGNVALESMGFKTIGFAGGRIDQWEPDLTYWGPEKKFLEANRKDKNGKLDKTVGATTMGLIYVNPEGPNGKPDPLAAAKDIRETFARMGMDDEETVALIVGGHTFGKTHGANKPEKCVGVEPAAGAIEDQGIGWKNKCGKGSGADAITSGLEGAWTSHPTKWTMGYLDNLFKYNWVLENSAGGAKQWVPDDKTAHTSQDAFDSTKKNLPVMLTTDLSLKFDPEYQKIAKRFHQNPEELQKSFAKAWFKLTHRDMGPSARYVGKEVPKQVFIWQDPLSVADYKQINNKDIISLKDKILNSGLTNSELISTAWASAASYRKTDMRGGANGARIRLEPQINWQANNPKQLSSVLSVLDKIKTDFNTTLTGNKKVSLADVIVLAGSVAVEKAAKDAGFAVKVPFKIGRVDATREQTDVKSFAALETMYDGFRNYYNKEAVLSPIQGLIDRAYMLDLTVPEMTVLVGGMRVLGANYDNSNYGVFTQKVGSLNNDFFVNLFDISTKWTKSSDLEGVYEGRDYKTGDLKWMATPVDLAFGSSSELRAVAEVYAADNGKVKFVNDFVKAWAKVMNLDRFE
jgi:catalase-peroxidase